MNHLIRVMVWENWGQRHASSSHRYHVVADIDPLIFYGPRHILFIALRNLYLIWWQAKYKHLIKKCGSSGLFDDRMLGFYCVGNRNFTLMSKNPTMSLYCLLLNMVLLRGRFWVQFSSILTCFPLGTLLIDMVSLFVFMLMILSCTSSRVHSTIAFVMTKNGCRIIFFSIFNIRPVAKDLGVWFDSTLSFERHIIKLEQSCFYHLRNSSKIRFIIIFKKTQTILHAFNQKYRSQLPDF